MIVNADPSLTIGNDDHLLTIVNDDPSLTKRGNRPDGHLYLSLSSFRKYQEVLAPPQLFNFMKDDIQQS